MTASRALYTQRLLLRGLVDSDVSALAKLAAAPEIAASTLLVPHPYSESEAVEFINSSRHAHERGEAEVFAITLQRGGELCGLAGLHPDLAHSRAELGYWIGVPYWGQGYATEAVRAVVHFGFRQLGLNRIFAMTFASNAASKRVLQKLGMRYEGCLRQHIVKWGKAVDLECYGILARELGE